MFYWLAAIPFFVAIMMIAVLNYPANDLNKTEDAQTNAMALRMVMQHDAAVKYIGECLGKNTVLLTNYTKLLTSTVRDEVKVDNSLKGNADYCAHKAYIKDGFIADDDTIDTYMTCSSSAEATSRAAGANCYDATNISVITFANEVKGSKWIASEQDRAALLQALQKYSGAFPLDKMTYGNVYKGLALAGSVPMTLVGNIVGITEGEEEYLSVFRKVDTKTVGATTSLVNVYERLPNEVHDFEAYRTDGGNDALALVDKIAIVTSAVIKPIIAVTACTVSGNECAANTNGRTSCVSSKCKEP